MTTQNSVRLFASDLDGTLLSSPEATSRFRTFWKRIPASRRPVLVYNSGRLVSDMLCLIQDNALDVPDYLIGGLGTEIYHVKSETRIREFEALLDLGWERSIVDSVANRQPGIQKQAAKYLNPHKSSWYIKNALRCELTALERRLEMARVKTQVVYSSNRDLDILPAGAGKGSALAWVSGLLSIPLENVLVAGDSGNDIDMFRLRGPRGIVVANHEPLLKKWIVSRRVFRAGLRAADGVVEGLTHYGLGAA